MNNELERIWNEKVVAQLKELSQHLSGGTEETHENPEVNRSPGQDLNPGPAEYVDHISVEKLPKDLLKEKLYPSCGIS
jgi:hypothetical protein